MTWGFFVVAALFFIVSGRMVEDYNYRGAVVAFGYGLVCLAIFIKLPVK